MRPEVSPSNPKHDRYRFASPRLGIHMLVEREMCFEHESREHRHASVQVLAVLEGWLRVRYRRSWHDAPTGSICVLPAGLPHQVAPAEGEPRVVYVDLHIMDQPELPMGIALRTLGGPGVFAAEAMALAAAAEALRGAVQSYPAPRAAAIMAALWRMVALIEAADAPPITATAEAPADPRLRVVESILRERIAAPLDITALARRVHLSPSQLNRLYQQHLGTTVARRMRAMRLEQARQLLQAATLSIKEIATRCGFANPDHFSRLFHDHFGRPPSAYRQQPSAALRPTSAAPARKSGR